MRRAWRAALGWRPSVRHHITWSGLAFTVLIVFIGLAAFASANNLLFLLLAALLATMLISGLVSRLGLAGLEVKLLLPENVFARRELPARIQLRNAKSWMPSFSLHLASTEAEEARMQLYFPIIPGSATLEALTQVYFPRRGIFGDSHYQFTTRFPFGFTERRLQVRLHREVLVYPSIDPQPGFEDLLFSLEGDMEAHFRGRGHDFYRIRPYEPAESARHVDWKATAHIGELQVREFAREEDQLVEVFLDLNVPIGKEAWLEQAIDCCAFFCWRLAARQGRLRFATQNFDVRLPEEGDIYTILKFLAQASPLGARAPVWPYEENSFQIVLSLSAAPFEQTGWHAARFLGVDAFSSAAGGSERPWGNSKPRAGAHLRHRHR